VRVFLKTKVPKCEGGKIPKLLEKRTYLQKMLMGRKLQFIKPSMNMMRLCLLSKKLRNLLMQELIQFSDKNQEVIDPLILAGIFHKQMVIIHPFIDGNGRTTRLATKILLAILGINTFKLFSFENYYNKNDDKNSKSSRVVTVFNFQGLLVFFFFK
jgi:hypothetical protein